MSHFPQENGDLWITWARWVPCLCATLCQKLTLSSCWEMELHMLLVVGTCDAKEFTLLRFWKYFILIFKTWQRQLNESQDHKGNPKVWGFCRSVFNCRLPLLENRQGWTHWQSTAQHQGQLVWYVQAQPLPDPLKFFKERINALPILKDKGARLEITLSAFRLFREKMPLHICSFQRENFALRFCEFWIPCIGRLFSVSDEETERGLEGNFGDVLFVPKENCNPTCRGTTYFFKVSDHLQLLCFFWHFKKGKLSSPLYSNSNS